MVYTRSTPDNSAVAALIAGGSCRVRAHGEAPLKAKAGSYLVRIAVGERTDSASALLAIYDSGDVGNAVGVRLLTGTAGITDDGQSITATALESWSSDGSQEYAFEVTLPEPTGEWVLSLRTDESSAAVPMDFSGWHLEDTLQRGSAQVGPGDIATSALGRCRYAAFSGLGAAATGAGGFTGNTTLNTASPANWELAATFATRVYPSATCTILGEFSGAREYVTVSSTGVLTLVTASGATAASAAGVFPATGYPCRLALRVNGAISQLLLNGTVLLSAATTYSAASFEHRIGGHPAGQRFPGAIWDVTFTDYTTAANSRVFLMDEPSGNYADSSGNGGTAATRNGYVSTVPVLSLDGRGMPWQGAPSPLVYSLYASLGATGVSTDGLVTFAGTLTEIDPTGSLSTAGVFTAPAPGVVQAYMSVVVDPTTIPVAENIEYGFRDGAGSAYLQGRRVQSIASGIVFMTLNEAVVLSVNTGTTLAPYVGSFNGTSVVDFQQPRVIYVFTPTPTTG